MKRKEPGAWIKYKNMKRRELGAWIEIKERADQKRSQQVNAAVRLQPFYSNTDRVV